MNKYISNTTIHQWCLWSSYVVRQLLGDILNHYCRVKQIRVQNVTEAPISLLLKTVILIHRYKTGADSASVVLQLCEFSYWVVEEAVRGWRGGGWGAGEVGQGWDGVRSSPSLLFLETPEWWGVRMLVTMEHETWSINPINQVQINH